MRQWISVARLIGAHDLWKAIGANLPARHTEPKVDADQIGILRSTAPASFPAWLEATLPPVPLLQPRGASSCAAPQLTDLAAGDLPDQIKRAQVDVTEKAGRPGPRGSILPGAAQNADAARNPPEEMTASPTLLEEGRSFPASPTAGHGGYGAELVKATGPAP